MNPAVRQPAAVSAARGVPRVLRGVALAGCSAALTVAGHAAAAGPLPSPGLTVVLTALLAAVGVLLARRRLGFPAILATLTASQAALHVLLSALGHPHEATALLTPSAAMVAVHAVAAVLTAVLLAGAEDAVFALAAVLRWILAVAVAGCRPLPVPSPAVPLGPVAGDGRSVVLTVLLRRVHARRGPPALRSDAVTTGCRSRETCRQGALSF